jgi:hypothetical protein
LTQVRIAAPQQIIGTEHCGSPAWIATSLIRVDVCSNPLHGAPNRISSPFKPVKFRYAKSTFPGEGADVSQSAAYASCVEDQTARPVLHGDEIPYVSEGSRGILGAISQSHSLVGLRLRRIDLERRASPSEPTPSLAVPPLHGESQ